MASAHLIRGHVVVVSWAGAPLQDNLKKNILSTVVGEKYSELGACGASHLEHDEDEIRAARLGQIHKHGFEPDAKPVGLPSRFLSARSKNNRLWRAYHSSIRSIVNVWSAHFVNYKYKNL